MALGSKRAEWMVKKVLLSHGGGGGGENDLTEDVVQKCFSANQKKIEAFLNDPEAPPKLFFFYQPRQFKNKPELYVSLVGDGEKLTGKCCYFLRTVAKPVKVAVASDNSVIHGELSSELLVGFQQSVAGLYGPLLKKADKWGAIQRPEDREPFMTDFDKFDENLKHKIDNLHGDVTLEVPQPPHDKIDQKPAAYQRAARNPAILEHFIDIIQKWCKKITTYMETDPSTIPLSPLSNEGPETEIDYWSRRMLTLISVTEQLKTKPSRVVTGVLKARALKVADESDKDSAEVARETEEIKGYIEKWREVDLAITDSLNEAKDNVRFLDNIRRVIEPLNKGKPSVIAESMPSLMNSMKMIHTLSRHYGTEVRMTNLFERITNQLIKRCKEEIYQGQGVSALWNQNPADAMDSMNASIALFETYQREYTETKATLAQMSLGKQFNFDEGCIFGKFAKFSTRLEKVLDMFKSIEQTRKLAAKRIDGLEKLISYFNQLITEFRGKGHDLLDFETTAFERDYVEFTMHNSGLENGITDFLENRLTRMTNILKQLELLSKFNDVLISDRLKEDLKKKYLLVFQMYAGDLHHIQELYEKFKDSPPVPRNMTRIAGNIHWSRQLLRRITFPMKQFQKHPGVFHPKESKLHVKKYNKLARTFIEFETLWYKAFQKTCEKSKEGLRARLMVADSSSNYEPVVNFDEGVLSMMREAKHLALMGFSIPIAAQTVLQYEQRLKEYYEDLSHLLRRYKKCLNDISPVVRSLLKPHLRHLSAFISPALKVMTWTSMNVPAFIQDFTKELDTFEDLIKQTNDITANRIELNLDYVTNLVFLNMPTSQSFTLKDFKTAQQEKIAECTKIIVAKNVEVERAVDDLIHTVTSYPIDEPKTEQIDINFVKLHYNHLMYYALLGATSRSLGELRHRVSSRGGMLLNSPLFEVDLSLQVPDVVVTPNMSEVQDVVQCVARDILQSTKAVMDWGIDTTGRTRPPVPFYNKLAADKNVAITLLLLTGALNESNKRAQSALTMYDKYSWMWMKEPEATYKEFVQKNNPILEDFISELHRFEALHAEVKNMSPTEGVGSLTFNTEKLKMQLKAESDRWMHQYSEKLHQEAKKEMEDTTELMKSLNTKLDRDCKDFINVKYVMDAQTEIREVSSWIRAKFNSIIERYNVLENFLPPGAMSKDEMDAKSVLTKQWEEMLALSESIMVTVNEVAPGYKVDLIESVSAFQVAVKTFRADYDVNGPMVKGTAPKEAITRLGKYKREFETLQRKYELYNGGEKLFGLPEIEYPELVTTQKELTLLDRLYSLYQVVITTIDDYKSIPWSEVVANIQTMNETVESFAAKCKTLPKTLKTWDAYKELSQGIEDFIGVLPLLMELSKPSMRDRHWAEISELTGREFDMEQFHELKLKNVLEHPTDKEAPALLFYKEDIEEITDGADKQLGIENKLIEIAAIWDDTYFEFGGWKERGEVILAGGVVAEIIEKLEESQSALVQMLTQKHVAPFRDQASTWLKKLSDVNDSLESWIKVQMLWMSLEAVFTGGDIARQMPQDTRVFQKVDKEWTTRLMAKSKDVRNVVECCQNEYIKNMLPTMFVDLEKCQKALDGYLEAKRSKFPRFYFVSNPALLLILSQGSDKDAVQDAFPKIFDAIDRVTFEGNNITTIMGMAGGYGGKLDVEEIALTKPIAAKGNIEDWLDLLLKEMMKTIHSIVRNCGGEFESLNVLDLIKKYCGQVSLMGIQMLWTNDVTDALTRSKNDKSALASATSNQKGVLATLSELTTKEIPTKMERTKIETLVTIQVHQVDVVEFLLQLYKDKKLKDASDFEWQKQLRLYWVPEQTHQGAAVVKVADVDFAYCDEYLGCKERLVITPLTDRCYISLTQAIGMCFGGAPAGPAGTGKTETTKDLGRALGKYVVVFNCSDQMHTADTAKIYKGLCQSGSWGCFDEFNRIDLEVLSVVAQQVEAILICLRTHGKQFSFPGDDIGPITVDTRCGFFITMNPGYAGRQELPENLKALFRGVAMMVPDREIIMKVKLASVGYNDYAGLAKKFCILYKLSEEQLSKQRHYDFGLRNILSVLRTGGVNLRLELGKEGGGGDRQDLEEMLMMRTLRDMNLAKLVADDVGLFISLLHDLFPAQADPEKRRYDQEEEAMKAIIDEYKLIQHDDWVAKIIQLYETSLVRHGLMMVGPAGGGKTEGTRVLVEAISRVKGQARIVKMSPKAITAEEMFGQNDVISGEWTHGIFSSIWAKYNDPKKHTTWIVCDGPVDAIWIENLNTVLDDNKLLTLANGDRVPMTDNVRILFEVQDLRNASPATVSRAGIVFVSDTDLGHEPIVEAWMLSRNKDEEKTLRELYDKFISGPDTFDWLMKNTQNCMKATRAHLMSNLLHVMYGLLKPSSDQAICLEPDCMERLWLYSMCWSLGSLLEAEDRFKFSAYMSDICEGNNIPSFGEEQCLYEFYVDPKTYEWVPWSAPEYEYDHDTFNFATALIPTMDSMRAEFLLQLLTQTCNRPVLIVGSSGTAKTSIVLQYTNTFDPTKRLLKKVNFSSATTAGMFQRSMEADIEKRQGKTFAPSGGRLMTVFLDDVSMPEVNTWGDQPTLEIVRQIIEERGFMFLEKDKRGDKMEIENVIYVGAMNHPGGGRNDIPARLKRHFFTVNCTPPSNESIDNIYGTMLRGHFEGYDEIQEMINSVTRGTIELWTKVKTKMLPTPSKFHYIFNMRDLSRIFQGILFCDHDCAEEGNNLLRLWLHECERVLCDKLVSDVDKAWYKTCAMKMMKEFFGEDEAKEISDIVATNPVYFVDFLRNDIIDEETDEVVELAPKVYELAPDNRTDFKARVENFLTLHNEEPGNKKMDLVLFTDALEHMLRISRIIAMPGGNALLVGIGGSGRQSLTRLAAFIARHEIFQIALTRTYKVADFLEDIRKMYTSVGKEGKKLTWIFTDFEILKEDFLEYINAILATGEVAGLFAKDERDMMCADLRGPAKAEIPGFEDTPENLYKYFLTRIRSHLHIVLVFSPANEKFAERARKFPGLIGCCQIDWFLRWPEQALVDVSNKFLAGDADFNVEVEKKEMEFTLVKHIAAVHNLVCQGCDDYFQSFRRAVHVTPKSYLAFIQAYKKVYNEKLKFIQKQENNVRVGLEKLMEAESGVDLMKDDLAKQQVELKEAEKAANIMLEKVEVGSKAADIELTAANEIAVKCAETAAEIQEETNKANKELEGAMPFVRAAEKAASSITKADVGTITKLGKPPDLIKRIMDCVLLLFQKGLDQVTMTTIKVGKDEFEMFVMDSYDTRAKKVMSDSSFINDLFDFAVSKKDLINDETIELLDPYLDVKDFNADRAKTVANAAVGLCSWVKAMHSYHHAALIVAPLLEALEIKRAMFAEAEAKLKEAEAKAAAAQAKVAELKNQFEQTIGEKNQLEADAKKTEDKMTAANDLIKSLGGEKVRWRADAARFSEAKKKLVGDVALSCAFVSYLGPFNQQYRNKLLKESFYVDAVDKKLPITKDLSVTGFLVDDAIIAEWNSQGLPKDDLSVQNGILVTQAARYPLMVDPQNQAVNWLKVREKDNFPHFGTTSLTAPKLRDELEFSMEEGKTLLVEGVVKEIDPMFDPVMEGNVIKKGRSQYILLGDKMVALDKNFRLFFITKLGNPTFSPELSAKTTVIDFSVTQRGLEDQLLSRVIQFEQKSLEDQRQELIEAVNQNTISLQRLDAELLDRLSNSTGNLLDDYELIQVLRNTKIKAKEVGEKIEASKQTEEIINKKREQYRPVAKRASIIYFVIVQIPGINVMYQISLGQFLQWFDSSMVDSEKANLVAQRVENLIDHLSFNIYQNTNRGLFECDKLTFKLMVVMQVYQLERPDMLTPQMVQLLLRGGAGLTQEQIQMHQKPFVWMQQNAWQNLVQLSLDLDFFGDMRNTIEQNVTEWKKWYEAEAPEEMEVPKLEERLNQHPSGPFMRMLLIRMLRDDRFRLAAGTYITESFGKKYTDPESIQLEDIWSDADRFTPTILLLTPGADPTTALQELAKKKGTKIFSVSMGEGQEKYAKRAIEEGMATGGWALLQNCHLGLGFMNQMDTIIDEAKKADDTEAGPHVDTGYRTWITCEPHKDFPINLLQMSIKVTNEPPAGMKAGLYRSYTSVVDDERLNRVETGEWRKLVFTTCFLHACVLERRKFGAVGWCIPYEFGGGDLEASLVFLEKHLFSGLSWPTIQYMICEVQYGGRITDDWDRILFNVFGVTWLTPATIEADFTFCDAAAFVYKIPDVETTAKYLEYIEDFPSHDTPEIFGLHTNADLTYGSSETRRILSTISDTQPKSSSASGGKTKEEIVYEKADELLAQTPEGYRDAIVREQIRKRSRKENEMVLGHAVDGAVDGFSIPLNVFLYQEVTRLNLAIGRVTKTFKELKQAIRGEIIMTPELQNALDSIYDAKPPISWYIDPSGAEIAWSAPSLALWFAGLLERNTQLHTWLNNTRPLSYWLTGFFNPQGFLTAARQEITRRHKADKWALDDVTIKTDVTEKADLKRIKEPPKEGFYVHGLFLEGASWDSQSKMLRESAPKELFCPLPVIMIGALTNRDAANFYAKGKYYDCPCYTKPRRTDLAYVFAVKLPSEKKSEHWTLRGVALLCSKE
jgi:dynein heavy chain